MAYKPRLRALLVPLALFSVFVAVFLFYRKDELRRDYAAFLDKNVHRALGLSIHVSRFGGNLFGKISFQGVVIRSENDPKKPILCKAEAIVFHYRLWDLFAKRLDGAMLIELDRPVFYAGVPFEPDRKAARPIELLSKFVAHLRDRTKLVIDRGAIAWADREGTLSGISGTIENRQFDLRVRIDHMPVAGADVSTELAIKARLETRAEGEVLAGHLRTLGTIVNWRPFQHESRLLFVLTPDRILLEDSSLLAGLRLSGSMRWREQEIDMALKASDYSLSHLSDLFQLPPGRQLSGEADADLKLSGKLMQPMIQGQLTLKNSRMGSDPFKNIQLAFAGVYPEVSLSESRIVLEDGTTMAFADQRIDVRELFDSDTYKTLITRKDQDDVMWGDWRLVRHDREDSMVVERGLGDAMKVKYERHGRDEAVIDPNEPKDEVELEYLLSGSDSFMVQMNEDDEKFVGVQKKVSF